MPPFLSDWVFWVTIFPFLQLLAIWYFYARKQQPAIWRWFVFFVGTLVILYAGLMWFMLAGFEGQLCIFTCIDTTFLSAVVALSITYFYGRRWWLGRKSI